MEWAAISISAIAAIGAAASGWIGWLILQRQKASEKPLVIVERLSPATSGNGSVLIEFTVANRSTFPWVIEQLVINTPVGAKLTPIEAVPREGAVWDPGAFRYDLIDQDALRNSITINCDIKAYGTQGRPLERGTSDRYSASAILFPPRLEPFNTISMRVILASKDADQRKMVIPITRDVTQVINTSTA